MYIDPEHLCNIMRAHHKQWYMNIQITAHSRLNTFAVGVKIRCYIQIAL